MWQLSLCCVIMFLRRGENAQYNNDVNVLPGKNMLNMVPEFLGQSPTTGIPKDLTTRISGYSNITSREDTQLFPTSLEASSVETLHYDYKPDPPDLRYPVQHAGLPLGLAVDPLPLEGSDYELCFNVSWLPAIGPQPKEYSIEVTSLTNTTNCWTHTCYEYNIPGESFWWIVPGYVNPVAESCVMRPGCAYNVRLIAHPWDGHTAANLFVELKECEKGVCSCEHASHLPKPVVTARTLSIQGEVFVNISWSLPPTSSKGLPPNLSKLYYFVSIGKQMVSDAHPAPWFANTVERRANASGPITINDGPRSMLLPIVERSGVQGGERNDKRNIKLDVRLQAKVSLVDDRGCFGNPGIATAYDPAAPIRENNIGTYLLWAAFGGAAVLIMAAVLLASTRIVKRILNSLRPASVPATLEPLRRHPAWFPMQLRM